MFEKVNPYLKEELNGEAVAHLCGCRCLANSNTMNMVINRGINRNGCYASCQSDFDANRDANYNQAYADRTHG